MIMKTRLLIILAIVIATLASLLISLIIYDSSTFTFIECVPPYEQVDGRCIMPTFKILLDDPIHPHDPLTVSIEKTGYYNCDEWGAKIIDTENNSTVWEKEHPTLCVVASPPKQQKIIYQISNENNPIIIDNVGRYLFQIDIGGQFLEEEFLILNSFGGISIDRTVYPVPDPNMPRTSIGLPSEYETSSLRPDDRLQIRHSAGYTGVYITLSSWDEYYEWEKSRGTEHDEMPPVIIDDSNINPIVFDLLNEMWDFKDYEVSKRDNGLFVKTIQKDYSVPNHHGIHDWLESEYEKQFGKSNDGFSHYFEYDDKVYTVIMVAGD